MLQSLLIDGMDVGVQEVYNESALPKHKEYISSMTDGSILYKDADPKVQNVNYKYYLLRTNKF